MRSIRAAVPALAALVLALAAACGGEDGPAPGERLAAAGEATAGAGTAAFSLEARIRTGPDTAAGTAVTLSGRGAADLRTGASRLAFDLPGLGLSLLMLFDGDTVFLRTPPAMAGGEARWIRRTVRARTGTASGPAGFSGRLGPLLAALEDVASGEIDRLGGDTVRGTDVVGYAFSVPGGTLWRGPGEVPSSLAGLEVPVRVWLDAADRVRRMTLETELGAAVAAVREAAGDSLAAGPLRMLEATAGGGSRRLAVTLELFDFGTEVATRPPDTAEVIDADSLEAGGTGLGGAVGGGR